jgi:hypothetical protein
MKTITTACSIALLYLITAQACTKDNSTEVQPQTTASTTNANTVNAAITNIVTATAPTAIADYLIIGRSGGLTGGAMGAYYRISTTDFKKDTSVKMPPTVSDGFNFNVLLSQADFNAVNSVRSTVPDDLIKAGSGTYGQVEPDAGYVEVWAGVGNVTYHWYFQADMKGVSADVQAFVTGVKVVYKY